MNTRQLLSRPALAFVLLALMLGTPACAQVPAGPRAWIDFPLDGSSVPVGTPVAVLAHAHSPDGVSEVLLSVNGAAYQRNPPAQPGAAFSEATLNWFPQQEGDYVLEVRAFSKNGQAVGSGMVRVRAIGKPTPTLPPTIPPLAGPITRVAQPDLAIIGVEAVVAGYKGPANDVPFCNTRVTYRNAGTAAVPRDYTVQFLFDGAPAWAATMAGGLAAGASAEATFVYQFEGSHTIGINIDSTGVIDEISETNNGYNGPLLCGGPTPVLPPTFTPTSTRTPTATPTLVTPPPPSGCTGTPSIASFIASPATITQGSPSTLSWGAVTNADSVSIDHGIGGVATPGSASVSPDSTTTYTLMARCGSTTATRQTTVTVLPLFQIITSTFTPTRTRTPTIITPPRDTTPPPIPNPQDPTGGKTITCTGATGSASLRWSSVTDPSGVTYYVKWDGGGQSGGWEGGGTSHGISIRCGYGYSWQVRACDGAGNCSNWSGSASFTAGGVH